MKRFRQGATLIVVVFIALVASLAVAAPAQAATKSGRALDKLNVRSGPGTNYKTVGSVAKNATVKYTCYKTGTQVTGPYGKSAYWLRLEGSAERFVSEAWVYTGTNKLLVGKCSAPAPAPKSLPARVDAFVSKWKGKYVHADNVNGAQCTDLFKKYHQEVMGGAYVRMAISGGAKDLWSTANNAQVNAKYTRVSVSSAPRKGDVAVWGGSWPYSSYGHVAIVLSASGSNFTALTQNPGAAKTQTFSKAHVLGFLRPKS